MKRLTMCSLLVALIFFSMISFGIKEASAEDLMYLWRMDDEQEISKYSNDNTGAKFALNSEIVFEGSHSVAIIPSGEAMETKLALELNGDQLTYWIGNNELILNIYIPENVEVSPQMFFLGMADVTTEWNWVGGIFGETEIQSGWNQLLYSLPTEMSALNSGKSYMLYFAFAGLDSAGSKVPLENEFYIDGIAIKRTVISRDELISKVSEEKKNQIAALVEMEEEELLDAVSKKTFDYFWNEVNPETGLIKDRSTEDSPSSVAAVGFGLSAIPVGIEHDWITYDEGYERVLTTLKTFANGGVEGKNGFYYHFVDMNTGKRAGECELSSIDTALFIAGALFVGEYFADTEVEHLADELYRSVNWQWMMNSGDTLSMGWKPEIGFLSARWNSFNESMVMYLLALGSPTYPIDPSAWDAIYRPVRDNYISLPDEVLFIYQYSHIWVDFQNKEDHYANYWNNSITATRMNRLFSILKRFNYESYDLDLWGLSASDGPTGYKAHGASEGNHDGTLAPYASLASMPFTPDLSIAALYAMLKEHGVLIWDRYGFVSAYNVDQNWYSDQYIGIDEGDILLMIENYRTGLIWDYFMRNEHIQKGLQQAGFKNKEAGYAVTPAYQQEFEAMLLAPKDKKAVATQKAQPVVIDGQIDEWAGLEYYVVDEDMNVPAGGLEKVNKKNQLLNSKFYAQWDEEYLYIAVEVQDEVVVSNIKPTDHMGFYRTDSIEFYIDPARGGKGSGLMKLAILPFDTEGNVQAIRHEDANPGHVNQSAPGLKIASMKSEQGYRIELAIPFKVLGVEGKPGVVLGFSHTVHNSNNRDAKLGEYVRTNLLAWNNLPEVWNNPDLWGELTLK